MSGPDALAAAARAALREAADPAKAPGMQVYMKSSMPFLGVTAPAVKAAMRPLVRDHPLDRGSWQATIRTLWDEAAFREERDAALQVASARQYEAFRNADALPLWLHLTVTGAWWDLVDATADLVGQSLRADAGVRPVVWAWATDDDLWLRRIAIISQLKSRSDTDLELLTHALDSNVQGTRHGGEFFIRKAIGWALRQHARTDPDWVRAFVAQRGDRLAPLSRREALKHLR